VTERIKAWSSASSGIISFHPSLQTFKQSFKQSYYRSFSSPIHPTLRNIPFRHIRQFTQTPSISPAPPVLFFVPDKPHSTSQRLTYLALYQTLGISLHKHAYLEPKLLCLLCLTTQLKGLIPPSLPCEF